ncbi:GntR family transcriptional regulator [Novosphingobium lindaniclasticum]|uniref:GntR family transcriptional regulator n=1 Tax=Novosphingobium lindaniclasticum TaxID=1329895 RepID=UPI00240A54DB|nr:GntR family transcriptional regulator [Novosphingobium lindaniclasticum]
MKHQQGGHAVAKVEGAGRRREMQPSSLSPETLVDIVEGRLREDIVNAVWDPGARLGVEELRQRYETGATPVREALSRLYAEGLVAMVRNRGFRVPLMSLEDLLDISRTRAAIEAAAMHHAVEFGTTRWEDEVQSAFSVLERRAELAFSEESERLSYHAAHHAFHAALLSGCQVPRLMALQSRLELQHSRYYRRLPFGIVTGPVRLQEHRALLELALARDADAASAAIAQHVMLTAQYVEDTGMENFLTAEYR